MYWATSFFDSAIVLASTVFEEWMIEKKTSWKTDSEMVVVVSVTLLDALRLCLTSSVDVSES
jgi:hypothetical protein